MYGNAQFMAETVHPALMPGGTSGFRQPADPLLRAVQEAGPGAESGS